MNVVQLLDRDATRAGDASAAGVLLGRTERGRQLTLIVEGYEAATPERGAPESPFKDRRLVESITDRWRPGLRRMSTLGFYRTCGREGGALSKDDLSALDASAVATDTNANWPNILNAEQKKSSVEGSEPQSPLNVASGVEVSSKAAPASSHGKEAERIFVLIEPRGVRGGNASIYLARAGTVLCQSPRIPFSRTELSRKEIVRQSPGSSMRDLSGGMEQTEVLRQEPKFHMPSNESAGTPFNWRWLLVAVGLIALLSVGFFQVSGQQMLRSSPADRERSNDSRLGLKLQRKGTDWELTWNQAAPILIQAKKAHLRITDDFIRKIIDLDPSELRNGRIVYTPMSDDVVVELEVEVAEPANKVSESVRIVAGLLPPIPRFEPHPMEASLDVRKASRLQARPSSKDGEGISEKRTAGKTPSATNSVRADAVQPKMHAETEASSDTKQVPEKAALTDETRALSVSPGSPLDTLPGGPELSATVPEPTQQGGQVLPAEVISRRAPVYPQEAKRRNISGTVEVHFKIDANGKVHDVTAVHGEPVLAQAAVQAIRGWRYKPERLDGVPTEVQATTVVLFRMN